MSGHRSLTDRNLVVMRLRIFILFLAFGALLCSSCQTQRAGAYYQAIEPDEVQAGVIGSEDFEMEIAYVGAIGHSFIFECYFKNESDQTVVLDKSQFYMEHGDGRVIFPTEGYVIADALEKEGRKLKKEKKTARTLSIIGLGISALASASAGAPVGEVLAFSVEPAVYIFDEQRWYKRGIESVEDEINYVREAQYEDYTLRPGEDAVRDLLFATERIKSDVTVYFSYGGEQYSVSFPKDIFR